LVRPKGTAVAVMLAAFLAYLHYPPLLFILLLTAVVTQLIAAPDQFLVIRDNRSHALVFGYVPALALSFGGAFLFGVSNLYGLLFFKIILIGTTALVPTCVVLIIGIREQ